VIVVRNGGAFDDNSVRQVIQPNSSLTSTGLFSSKHPYPSTQRTFTVSGQEDADSNEIINVPAKNGVLVGVEGTVYFDVNYTDEKVMVQAAVNEAFTKDVDDVLGVALLINPRSC
jgi:hypothetical protein